MTFWVGDLKLEKLDILVDVLKMGDLVEFSVELLEKIKVEDDGI